MHEVRLLVASLRCPAEMHEVRLLASVKLTEVETAKSRENAIPII